MKHYVGLDVSLKETAVCVVDEAGDIVGEGKVLSEPGAIIAWLAHLDLSIAKVGLEIGGLARWLHGELRAAGLPVVCIDPRRLRGLTRTMPVKTDRNDARAIAQVTRVGWYRAVHVKSEVSQELRMLLTNRKTLLSKQIDLENEVRGTLRVFGLKLAGRVTQASFERRALELVADAPRLAAMVRPMLAARAALRQQCAVLHKMTLDVARRSSTCQRMMTVPGVGALTAVTCLTTIDDPERFRHSRDLGPHLGLTPRKYASGEVDRNGAISKSGDAPLRATPYQAALALLTRAQRSLVDTQGVGHRRRAAAGPAPSRCRRRPQAGDRPAPDLDRRQRVPLVARGSSRLIGCHQQLLSREAGSREDWVGMTALQRECLEHAYL